MSDKGRSEVKVCVQPPHLSTRLTVTKDQKAVLEKSWSAVVVAAVPTDDAGYLSALYSTAEVVKVRVSDYGTHILYCQQHTSMV